jgi:hypothetical protein
MSSESALFSLKLQVDKAKKGLGMTDRDCEIKFNTGGVHQSIDVWKQQTDLAREYYKVLVVLADQMSNHDKLFSLANSFASYSKITDPVNANGFLAMQWAEAATAAYKPVNYGYVFQKFTNLFPPIQ